MQTIEGKRLTLFSLHSYVEGIKKSLDEIQEQLEKQGDNESNQKTYFNLMQVVDSLSDSINDISDRLTILEKQVVSISSTSTDSTTNQKIKNNLQWIYKIFKKKERR